MKLKRQKDEKSMFNEKDFESVKNIFETNNPELASNPAQIEREIEKMKKEINDFLNLGENGKVAAEVTIQVLNFLARYLGKPEFCLYKEEKDAPENPMEKKHVGIFIPRESEIFKKAITKTFQAVLRDDVNYEFYDNRAELLSAIKEGALCGIVAMWPGRKEAIEGQLRHDLKNQKGWNYESAEKAVFPPCQDLGLSR